MGRPLASALIVLAIARPLFAAGKPESQCSPTSVLVVLVEETSIPLSQTKTERIPYGRDLTVLIRTDSAATAVSLAYEFSGGSDGPRSGRINAVKDGSKTCWAAALPKVRLNETGTFTAIIATPPKYRPDQSTTTFTDSVLLKLARLPSPLSPDDFVKLSGEAVSDAAKASFASPAESLFVPTPEGEWQPLQNSVSGVVSREIQYTNVFNNVRNNAGKLIRAMPEVLKVPSLAARTVDGCAVGSTLGELEASATLLKKESDADLSARVVAGGLPWPDCALQLVSEFPDTGDPGRVASAVRGLVESQQLRDFLRVAAEVRALSKELALARTFEAPIGADLLERYTQVDMVSAYMPAEDAAQAFAAATWYFFNPKGDYTGKIQPSGWGGNRFGLQVGYPVGTLSDSDNPFKADILVGLIGRVNGVLSLTGGVVFGKDGSGKSKQPVFFSLNVDLSNLGPLQQLFARRDK